jgi:hypothetical protein
VKGRPDEAVELYEWFLKKYNIVQVLSLDIGALQAEINGILWVIEIVLFPGEPFFLGSRDQYTVLYKGSGCVVEIAGYP